jgi:putative nucleotidyltransferase with HDIG domain
MNEFKHEWNRQHQFTEAKLPVAVHEVVRLVNEPKTSVARLAAAVAQHHALAESVLRKANVSTSGLQGRVKNLNSAVVVLGLDALKATSRSVLVSSTGRKMTHTVVRHQDMWEHSIGCAITARMLASRSGKCNPDDAYVAGILHDVGAMFTNGQDQGRGTGFAPSGTLAIPKPVLEGSHRFVHAHIGADKAEQWGLALDIVEAIRFHHLPRLATTNSFLAGVVHLAEFLCHRLHIGTAEFEHADVCDNGMLARLGMPQISSAEELMDSFDGLIKHEIQQMPRLDDEVKRLKDSLFATLEGLLEEQRIMIALHYYEGLSVEEIGQLLEVPVPATRAYISEALAQLQEALNI